MSKQELEKKIKEARNAAKQILDKAEAEKRELTPEERQSYDKAIADMETLKGDIERRSKFDALDAALNAPVGGRIAPGGVEDRSNSLGVPDKDLRKYSLLRAIDVVVSGKQLDGLEGELSQEIARRSGKSSRGFWMPMEIGLERRDLTTSTGAGGVASTVLFQDFITLLRSKLVMRALGARFMDGLVGDFAIPRQSGGATGYWVTEGNTPTASNQTIDSVQLSPKTVGANTLVTRKFLKQTAMSAEAFVRDDLAKALASEIDRVAIEGSGVGAEPEGLLVMTGLPDDIDVAGGPMTFAKCVDMETALADANADINALAYLTNSKVRGQLKKSLEFSASGSERVWRNDNTVNSYRAFASNLVPADIGSGGSEGDGSLSAMIFGNWDDLIIGQWGGLDVTVDPYTQSKSGGIVISALQEADIKVRHKASFVRSQNIGTT